MTKAEFYAKYQLSVRVLDGAGEMPIGEEDTSSTIVCLCEDPDSGSRIGSCELRTKGSRRSIDVAGWLLNMQNACQQAERCGGDFAVFVMSTDTGEYAIVREEFERATGLRAAMLQLFGETGYADFLAFPANELCGLMNEAVRQGGIRAYNCAA